MMTFAQSRPKVRFDDLLLRLMRHVEYLSMTQLTSNLKKKVHSFLQTLNRILLLSCNAKHCIITKFNSQGVHKLLQHCKLLA